MKKLVFSAMIVGLLGIASLVGGVMLQSPVLLILSIVVIGPAFWATVGYGVAILQSRYVFARKDDGVAAPVRTVRTGSGATVQRLG